MNDHTLTGEWIDKMDYRRYSLDNTNLSNSSKLVGQFCWQAYYTIFANWNYINTVGEFAIVRIAVNILRYDGL